MSADVVNLRRARKAMQRVDRAEASAENRVRHGLTRAERDTRAIEADRAARLLDGHRIGAIPTDDA